MRRRRTTAYDHSKRWSEDLEWSARVAVGLDTLARDFDLSALAYYYRGLEGNENEQVTAGMIVGNSFAPLTNPIFFNVHYRVRGLIL